MPTCIDEAVSPPLQQRKIDPVKELAYIKTQISAIYTAAKDTDNFNHPHHYLGTDTWLGIALGVVFFCNATANPEVLYPYLIAEIRTHCKSIRNDIFNIDGFYGMNDTIARKILAEYQAHKVRFNNLTYEVRVLMGLWDRNWLHKEWEAGKLPAASIEDLHRAIWIEQILEKGDSKKRGVLVLQEAVRTLNETPGGIAEDDLALAGDFVKSLAKLDVAWAKYVEPAETFYLELYDWCLKKHGLDDNE